MNYCKACNWATVTCNNCGGQICKNCDVCSTEDCSVECPRGSFDIQMDLELATDPVEVVRLTEELVGALSFEEWELDTFGAQ